MIMYFDVHAHLSEVKDRNTLLTYLFKHKPYVIAATYDVDDYKYNKLHFSDIENVRVGLGYHPDSIGKFEFNKDEFARLLFETKYVSEVGLDFSQSYIKTKSQQLVIFDDITSLAKDKIMIVHSRNAEKEVFETLQKHHAKYVIFHWYTGNQQVLKKIVEAGYYLSFNLRMLNSQKGEEVCRVTPINQILVESDVPFTCKNVSNDYYKKIYNRISDIKKKDSIEVSLFENFSRLLTDYANSQ